MHHSIIDLLITGVGVPDGRYFSGLAGILLLILQRPVKGRYFDNQWPKPVF